MSIKDVTVIVTRETAVLTQAGFGMPLILATNETKDYQEYVDLASVAEDYSETTDAYKIANAVFAQNPSPTKLAILGVSYDPGTDTPTDLTSALNTLVDKRDDWYFLLCDQNGDDEIEALAGWVNAQNKLYFATTQNLTLVDGMESERTAIMYHDDPEEYAAEAWVGACAPQLPGSITWKNQQLNGITEPDIGVADMTALHDNGGNTIKRQLGILVTSNAWVTTGTEYIDVMRSSDFLEARLQEAVTRLLIVNGKIPYDNTGIAQVVAACEPVLQQASEQGIVAYDDEEERFMWEITAPRREDIPVNDIASRKLDNVKIEVTLAGAIHEVTLRVTLKY